MRQAARIVLINVAVLCVLLVGLEAVGQALFRALKGYPIYQSDQHLISESREQLFELHPWLVARLRAGARVAQGGKLVTSTPFHTRSTGADTAVPGAIRVAVVGGSTTFGSGVTDDDSWPARLQAQLGPGYLVLNFGMPGYSTAEGIVQAALLVPESRPDVVVFFEGWNDLHNAHDPRLGADYYGHGMRQYANLDIERPQPAGFVAKLAEVSAIGRAALVLGKRLLPAQAPAPAATPVAASLRAEPDTFVERIYRRNLGTLRVLARRMGAHALFVPQVVDASRLRGTGGHAWTPALVDSAVPGLIARLNAIMAEECPPGAADCEVVDDVARHPWQPDDFLDEGHFVRKGNEAFATLLAARIRGAVARGVIRPAAPPR